MKRFKTNRIIFHHSLSEDVSAKTIKRWHKEKGWSDIGYHYIIRQNGDVEIGRGIEDVGAHAKGNNLDSIGICFTGDFSRHTPTPAQLNSAVDLVRLLKYNYGDLDTEFHHEGCPGKHFNRDSFLDMLYLNKGRPT